MDISIKIELRQVYGETKFYPACDKALRLAQIAGTKTLTRATLEQAEAMGFHVKVVAANASWKEVA